MVFTSACIYVCNGLLPYDFADRNGNRHVRTHKDRRLNHRPHPALGAVALFCWTGLVSFLSVAAALTNTLTSILAVLWRSVGVRLSLLLSAIPPWPGYFLGAGLRLSKSFRWPGLPKGETQSQRSPWGLNLFHFCPDLYDLLVVGVY